MGDRGAKFTFVGDYIDRGTHSREVVEFLIRAKTLQASPFICLRGNHEEMLIRVSDKDRSDRDLMTWWGNGGEQTLESYAVNDPSDIPRNILTGCVACPCRPATGIGCSCMPELGLALRCQINQSRTCCGYESRFCHPTDSRRPRGA